MSVRLNQSLKPSPVSHLPEDLQAEINKQVNEVDKHMVSLLMDGRGAVRQWLLQGQAPTDQMLLAIRDAPEDEWAKLIEAARYSGAPITGTTAAGNRAPFELKHKWKSVMRMVRDRVPAGADLGSWPGYVALAEAMLAQQE